MADKFKEALESARNTERKMDIGELGDDITELLLKYSGGTGIANLTMTEFNVLNNLLYNIIKNPQEFIK
jgi:hypothetical protein